MRRTQEHWVVLQESLQGLLAVRIRVKQSFECSQEYRVLATSRRSWIEGAQMRIARMRNQCGAEYIVLRPKRGEISVPHLTLETREYLYAIPSSHKAHRRTRNKRLRGCSGTCLGD